VLQYVFKWFDQFPSNAVLCQAAARLSV